METTNTNEEQPKLAKEIPEEYKNYRLPIERVPSESEPAETVNFAFKRGRATDECPEGELYLAIEKDTPPDKIARWVGVDKLVRLVLSRLNVNFKGFFKRSVVDGAFDAEMFKVLASALEIFIRTRDEILEDMQACMEEAKKNNKPAATASAEEKLAWAEKLSDIYTKMGKLNEELEQKKRNKKSDDE